MMKSISNAWKKSTNLHLLSTRQGTYVLLNFDFSVILISVKNYFRFRYLVTNLEIFREITCTLGSFPQATWHSSGAWFHECKLFRQPSSPIHLKRNSKKFLISEFQVLCWKYKIFLKSVGPINTNVQPGAVSIPHHIY